MSTPKPQPNQQILLSSIGNALYQTNLFFQLGYMYLPDKPNDIYMAAVPLVIFGDMIDMSNTDPKNFKFVYRIPDESLLISDEIIQQKTEEAVTQIMLRYIHGNRVKAYTYTEEDIESYEAEA